MPRSNVHTWTFVAQTPVGTSVTLHAYLADPPLAQGAFEHDYIDSTLPVLVTDDGEPVSRLDQGIYTLLTTGTIVASVDPNAP